MPKNRKGETVMPGEVQEGFLEKFHNSPEYKCLTKGHKFPKAKSGDTFIVCKVCRAELEIKEDE